MQKGDRIHVVIPGDRRTDFVGTIVGEARDGTAWLVLKDGTGYSRGVHKSFCHPEAEDDRAG